MKITWQFFDAVLFSFTAKPLGSVFVNRDTFFHFHLLASNMEVIPQNALEFRVFHLVGKQADQHFVVAFVQNAAPV